MSVKTMRFLTAILTTFLFLSSLFVSKAMAVEEPSYQVLQAEPPIELRRYPGFIVAETEVNGDFDAASRTGFRRVAGYIFGDNQAPAGGSRKIAMTAPVTVEPKEGGGWRLHFVMPSSESLTSLPQPGNPEVAIRPVPEHDVAAIRFSGWTTQASIATNTAQLEAWMAEKNLQAAGAPKVARYDDPFTLPWRRRNEILIPVAK
jgi:hypothetical protein